MSLSTDASWLAHASSPDTTPWPKYIYKNTVGLWKTEMVNKRKQWKSQPCGLQVKSVKGRPGRVKTRIETHTWNVVSLSSGES